MEEYRNILANKFMRDTNYIIIKDTDDLEELERQWELFQSSLTVRQQRLSDDRSLQIWNMTNQQHYETLKAELMGDLQNKLGIEYDEPTSIEYEPDDDEKIDDSEITNFVNMSFDDFEIPDDENEINEPIKEDSIIPTDGKELNEKQKLNNEIKADMNKDAQADQYEIDSNINIIGSIKGFTPQERLDNLEKAFRDWNSQNQDHRKKSDDKCREIYGMSNIDRYNKLKGIFVKMSAPKTDKDVSKTISNHTNSSEEALSEFTLEVYRNMQVVNEAESNKAKQHRRLNDTPYFTPSEMIDMGVHGNHNYYCKDADNDGLITRVRIPTWFDSYKDMCMDHIFEDYTKDWIDTLDYLYSDFEEIKESGNEEKILARKQSILDLGWNPEIPFTRRNRQLASKRVSKLLDKSSPMNLFINLDKEVPDEAITDEPVTENASKDTHQPIYMVFVQGKAPIVSTAIKKVTNSPFSHAGISFDSKLDTVHTYNMVPKPGVVKETLSGYKDNIITVMAFFAPTDIYNTMKDTVMDYYINAKKTVYDFGIIFNKLINKNARVVNDKYHQICSTFVDTVLKSGKVTLDKDANVPSPAELYNATKSMPNKIIEVYSGPADKYDSTKVDKKMNKLLEKGTKAIDEATDIDSQIKLVPATQSDTENMYNWKIESVDKSIQSDSKVISYIKQNAQDSIKDTKMITYNNKTIGMLTCYYIDNGEWWYIDEIYLIPEYRNKGIGTKLIKEQIQSHDKIKLQVAYSNKSAIKLYKSLGFETVDKNDKGKFYIMAYDKAFVNESKLTDKIKSKRADMDLELTAKTYDALSHLTKDEKKKAEMKKRAASARSMKGLLDFDEETITEGIHDIMNGTNPFSTKTFYHISFDDNLDDKILKPRVPSWITKQMKDDPNFIKELEKLKDPDSTEGYGFEEYKTPRVCLSNSIEGCLNAIINEKGRMHLAGKTLYVYIPEKPISEYKTKTNKQILKDGDVFDANATNEMWILEPVKMKYVGSIVVDKITGEHIKKHVNNKNKTNIKYDYKWHWFHKVKYRYNPEKNKFVTESVLNEVKQFPVEFDQDGNLIIYKARIGSIAYGDEIDDSVKLLESYRNTNNIEGMKYELAKLWFINDSIEKKLKKKLTNDQYKELIDHRATCLNVFKLNLEYVMKAEKGFNFSDYYNSTPFSDNSVKITANTLKYSMKAIASMI